MAAHVTVAVAAADPGSPREQHLQLHLDHHNHNHHNASYGATTSHSQQPTVHILEPLPDGTNGYDYDEEDDCDDIQDPLLEVSWVWLSRLYLLVPVVTALCFASLVALVTYGWPPSKDERKEGQSYPHPFFWQAFLVGLFASFTVQSFRVPMFVATSWLHLSATWTVFLSTVFHAILHEAVRLVSVPLVKPSPTSGFHSSFWLGLGWGLAETAWGIVQGWEQLSLYEDVLKGPQEIAGWADIEGDSGLTTVPEEAPLIAEDDDDDDRDDEIAELERRVEVLERFRARRELEDVMGIPFPLIPFPLHMLWRIDTLLLNLGLTLILSAFWLDPEPIYHHGVGHIGHPLPSREWPPARPNPEPSPYLGVAWCLVALLHIISALVWKVVGRVGVGAVTWGGLIVALGTVFAGLGEWGGLV